MNQELSHVKQTYIYVFKSLNDGKKINYMLHKVKFLKKMEIKIFRR